MLSRILEKKLKKHFAELNSVKVSCRGVVQLGGLVGGSPVPLGFRFSLKLSSVLKIKNTCLFQAWIAQLVAHQLGTMEVVGSDHGKGESIFPDSNLN